MQNKTITVTHLDMGWLEFLSVIIPSLAWPLAALSIVYILRHSIASLLDRIRELDVFGNKISLREQIKEAEFVAEFVMGEPLDDIDLGESSFGKSDSDSDADSDADADADADTDAHNGGKSIRSLTPLAGDVKGYTPLEAINFEWFRLDAALRKILKSSNDLQSQSSIIEKAPIGSILDELMVSGKISSEQRTLITQLSAIQETALRLGRATAPDAMSFARLSRLVWKNINR